MSKTAIMVFHDGERQIQRHLGQEKVADLIARAIRDQIVQGAFNFIERQPMVIVSSVDQVKNVWVSALIGELGFIRVPDVNRLEIHTEKIVSTSSDIFFSNTKNNSQIGTLFIELSTRIRYRVNGRATWENGILHVAVQEAYSNCPKFIQKRIISLSEHFHMTNSTTRKGTSLNTDFTKWISSADTFFVGSQGLNESLDASHRGGNKGFIEVTDEKTLKIPDYPGNSIYNTLGNFVQNPKAGLLFIDFTRGRTLQLTGEAEILLDQNNKIDLEKSGGMGIFWLFNVKEWILTENHHLANWEFLEFSPHNL